MTSSYATDSEQFLLSVRSTDLHVCQGKREKTVDVTRTSRSSNGAKAIA
jgi:hypothetical protein